MSMPLVAIRALSHTYLAGTPLETRALTQVDLTVRPAEIAALVGPGGAGKSTLSHYVNALHRPSRTGCVSVLGQDTASPRCDLGRLRQDVGLVLQSPHLQLLERFVGDDIAFGPRRQGLAGDTLRERVRWAMEAVGLDFERFKDRRTFSLSGGEMRRVAIAGVLATLPQLVVLDEATTGLDPRGRRRVHAILREQRASRGMAALIISNSMDEVAALADSVTVLDQGRSVLSGPTREVMCRAKALREIGLASPSAQAICQALSEGGLPVSTEVLTPLEAEEAIWQAMTR